MLALGLLFIVVATLVTAGAIYDGGESATFSLLGQTIHTSVAGIFLTGVATMIVFFLGLWMVMKAMGRTRRKRHERKAASREQQQTVSAAEQEREQLKAENERLAAQLARESRPVDDTSHPTVLPAADVTDSTPHETSTSTSGRHGV